MVSQMLFHYSITVNVEVAVCWQESANLINLIQLLAPASIGSLDVEMSKTGSRWMVVSPRNNLTF